MTGIRWRLVTVAPRLNVTIVRIRETVVTFVRAWRTNVTIVAGPGPTVTFGCVVGTHAAARPIVAFGCVAGTRSAAWSMLIPG